jgi:hypothetical protein
MAMFVTAPIAKTHSQPQSVLRVHPSGREFFVQLIASSIDARRPHFSARQPVRVVSTTNTVATFTDRRMSRHQPIRPAP